jgi:hypothetical protein
MKSNGFSLEILGKRIKASFFEEKAPGICGKMEACLPLKSVALHAKFAGQELIVMVPFYSEPENEILNVASGDVGYYPGRQTICIFYGNTVPFGKVSVFAKIEGGLDILKEAGERILAIAPLNTTLEIL